ncbi:MAG: hypothetical protein JEZ14_22850 [Marinilabiliaceae bacterium]|nr:hypothetical protein [Marinilabiliaceae bacterium]
MKRKFINFLGLVVLVAIVAINGYMKKGSSVSNLSLDNMEALACYPLEDSDGFSGSCCYPWSWTCYYGMPGWAK